MKFHVNPKTGNPSVCHALIKCRFGGESEHYFTKSQAREDYEKKNAAFSAPESLAAAGQVSRAKKTRRIEEMNQIISTGNEACLINLANNRHVTPEILQKAWAASDSDLVKTAIALNPKCPVEIIDKKRMLDFKFRGIEKDLRKKLESDDVTEDQAKIVLENFRGSEVSEAILSNPNTKLSQKTLFNLALMTNNGRHLDAALKNPKFDTNAALKTGIYDGYLADAAIATKDPAARQFIYNHPNTSNRTREYLVENHPGEKFGS